MNTLTAQPRTVFGKAVKTLRKGGFLPAVMYGEGVQTQSISVSYKDFVKTLEAAGESTILTLDIAGTPFNVLIHDVEYDPVSDAPIHADFYTVRMDRLIRAHVSIVFIGESEGVKTEGGTLVKVMQELEIEALPADLPHELVADLSLLKTIGSHLLVKDIPVPKGVRIHAEPEKAIAIVEAPRSDAELAELLQTPAAATAEPVKTEREAKEAKKKDSEEVEA